MKLLYVSTCVVALAAAWACWLVAQPVPAVLREFGYAPVVLDSAGGVLRELKDDDGLRADVIAHSALPPVFVSALLASEDHRFYEHPGVDALAVVRALWLNTRALGRVSGASTLAMQLTRIAYDLPRDSLGKLKELVLAPALTARLGRAQLLDAYVNLVHFGRDLRGLRAASRAYFGKPPADLTVGEAVALACLPRAPSAYDLYTHAPRLRARRRHVLALMVQRGLLSAEVADAAAEEPLRLRPFERTFRAPHAVALALAEARSVTRGIVARVETTLDPALQTLAQHTCAEVVQQLADRGATACAAVVMRAAHMEILALVGSPNFSSAQAGQVNAALAPRQPGSALKPFVYAMAFEAGRSPGDIIADDATLFSAEFGLYRPENYDRVFHGPVTLREALANSYNIPAAKLARDVGVPALLARLRALGLATLDQSPAHYGVGLALGDGEVRLLDLTAAYAVLARGGTYQRPTLLARVLVGDAPQPLPARATERVIRAEAAFMVSDVLADDAARRAAFGAGSVLEMPFRTAVKTGTSSHYRDNLTLGYAGDIVVGVWVGRHDGGPLRGVSGVSGAGPAFRRIMLAAAAREPAQPSALPAELARVTRGERRDLASRPRP